MNIWGGKTRGETVMEFIQQMGQWFPQLQGGPPALFCMLGLKILVSFNSQLFMTYNMAETPSDFYS